MSQSELTKLKQKPRPTLHRVLVLDSEPSTLSKQKNQTKPWNHEQKLQKQDYQTHQKWENKAK